MSAPWWDQIGQLANQRPKEQRALLVLQGLAIGSIAVPLAQQMLREDLVSLRGFQGESIHLLGDPSARLAEIATWLRASGHAAPWRDELVAVAASDGQIVGCVERAVVRNLGIATHAVQLHGRVQGSDQYWLQLRAFDKQTDPGRWDTLMGGLIANGESILQTLERETQEEAGLSVETLLGVEACGSFILRRPVEDSGTHGYMVETLHAFRCVVPQTARPLNQDGEVASFGRFNDLEIDAAINRGEVTLEAAAAIAMSRGLIR